MAVGRLLNVEKIKAEHALQSSNMLPRQFRLPASIRLSQPNIYTTPYFVVKIAPNELPYNRFGFTISKAIAKHAVDRNKVRRVLRSCIEERLNNMHGGYDMLFLLKKGIIDKERETLASEIEKLLTQKKLLK
jgi:ribonuclease P protein component